VGVPALYKRDNFWTVEGEKHVLQFHENSTSLSHAFHEDFLNWAHLAEVPFLKGYRSERRAG
jgi:hypothetical protein